ncbi:MutS2 protein [Desulfovibrio sp. X2]|uniref:endonuclease MutS2 n=1 Tax=Desulfovibrio sp. X2 TaxID=941449 RepID=UPI0003586EA8|nr:Smr/MutS family protein [Desulfovibrio sp. X2]EPR42240.1 MutS2 protein [Desulfovibrio sp. X2]
MERRTFHLLEFPKVLAALASHAVSDDGRERCLATVPIEDDGELALVTARTAEVQAWQAESGYALPGWPSLSGLFGFVAGPHAVLDQDALVAVRDVLSAAMSLRQALSGFVSRGWDALFDLVHGAAYPETLAAGLKRCLDPDGRLKDESSPELFSVRSEIRSINQTCTKKVKDFLQKEGLAPYLQEDYITISSDRFVVPLKTSFKNRFPGIIHDYSQTGETCYFEPMFLVDVNNRLQELRYEEREEERKVLALLTGYVRQELAQLRATVELLAEVDCLLAKAALASALDAHPLLPAHGSILRLLDARHPLLALSAGKDVQAQDIALQDEQLALIVSGGNAGGKTVCLKTLGLIALMAHSGLPVPAAEGSSLPRYAKIFAFLGDEQSLEEHLSTFSAQIRSLTRVWDQMDAETLVILDEFGAGTDPAQGAALAQAVVDSLMEHGAMCVCATHFPGLKAYGLSNPRVRSASVLFDPATKRPLFKLAYDQVGASIALDVAREHGLPEEILRRAEQNLLLEGGDNARILNRLNELAVDREKELSELRVEQRKLKEKRVRLQERYEQEQTKAMERLTAASQEIVRAWREGKIERKKALADLAAKRDALAAEMRPAPEPETALTLDSLAIGERVRYLPWDKLGTVQDKDLKRRQAKVDIGGVSLWVEAHDLGRSAPLQTASPKPRVTVQAGAGDHFSLDIRGFRADAALSELARFLDQALLKGLSRAEIIHGKGSGALRREVHAFLKDFPPVTHFFLASEEEGGDGKTIVEFA